MDDVRRLDDRSVEFRDLVLDGRTVVADRLQLS